MIYVILGVYLLVFFFFFFKQKTAYEMRISDWSSDVCSSDLNKVFTLSQFLEDRFNSETRLVYTFLMLAFIMIQLIAGFYIGSRTLGVLFEGTSMEPTYLQGIYIIAAVTIVFTVFGGMTSVVIADNILTVIMVIAVDRKSTRLNSSH